MINKKLTLKICLFENESKQQTANVRSQNTFSKDATKVDRPTSLGSAIIHKDFEEEDDEKHLWDKDTSISTKHDDWVFYADEEPDWRKMSDEEWHKHALKVLGHLRK